MCVFMSCVAYQAIDPARALNVSRVLLDRLCPVLCEYVCGCMHVCV